MRIHHLLLLNIPAIAIPFFHLVIMQSFMITKNKFARLGVDNILRNHHDILLRELSWTPFPCIFSLHRISLDYNFLMAASQCWDSINHVFRFGRQELCPTIEEFAAICDHVLNPDFEQFVMPPTSLRYPKAMMDAFGLSAREVHAICDDGTRVCIPSLLGLNALYENPSSRSSLNILCFSMLSQYFLISHSENHYRLLSVVDQLQRGFDPFPLILAETLIALDEVSVEEPLLGGGSPLLLQVHFLSSVLLFLDRDSVLIHFLLAQLWLQEKLNLLIPPSPGFRWGSSSYHTRRVALVFDVDGSPISSVGGWFHWLGNRTTNSIRWLCPWMQIRTIVARTHEQGAVLLLSFSKVTFYYPNSSVFERGRPDVFTPLSGDGLVSPLNASSLKFYRRCWSTKRRDLLCFQFDW